jgi:hypothetical protein
MSIQQKVEGRFVVHVYKATTKGVNANTYYYDNEDLAKQFCDTCFEKSDVYKVKLWDLRKGPIVPNRRGPGVPGLIYELV